MSARHATPLRQVAKVRLLGAGVVATTGLALTGAGVMAGLNAQASNPQAESVTAGTLKLEMTSRGAGFTSAVDGLAPGDAVSRYVDLGNTGSLDGKNLTLGVADKTPTPSVLTTDASKGLHVTVTECVGSWSMATGTCAGAATTLLADTAVSTLSTTPAALPTPVMTAGKSHALQITVKLPDQTETTKDGALPANTVQGQTASLAWTFTMTQRDAKATGA